MSDVKIFGRPYKNNDRKRGNKCLEIIMIVIGILFIVIGVLSTLPISEVVGILIVSLGVINIISGIYIFKE